MTDHEETNEDTDRVRRGAAAESLRGRIEEALDGVLDVAVTPERNRT